MVTETTKRNLRERYAHIHPLIFHRSCACAKSAGDLFDILEGIPDYPVVWNSRLHQWVTVEDVRKPIASD